MATINQIKHIVSKLSQRRYYLEKGIENIPKMLSACLILRYRETGTRDFQSIERRSKSPSGKSYAYLTCFYRGRNIYRYVPKNEIDKVEKLTSAYRIFCQSMQQVREFNRRLVELLDKIGEIQQEEIKDYVEKRVKRIRKSLIKARKILTSNSN